jgi:sugar lactone lactonase YvrE
MTRPTAFEAHPAAPDRYLLAEGPVWDPVGERLLWVDIERGRVHIGVLAGDRIEPGGSTSFDGRVGAAVLAADGTLLAAVERELVLLSPDGARTVLTTLLPPGAGSRLNDGGCDPAGRFVVGAMALDDRTGGESLWQVGRDGSTRVVDADLTLSNGLGWSPDGSTLYSIDTEPGIVWARPYRPGSGETGPRRELFRVTDGGSPDGMCVDAAGNLWIAVWGGGQIRCHAPSGEVLAVVDVPGAPHTSCCAFAGRDLDLLVITTARTGLPAELPPDAAGSGLLFTARVGVTGAPVPYWEGPA